MFDLFKNMGAMVGLLSSVPRLQEQIQAMQARLGQILVEGDAGAGMVRAKVNGRLELLAVTLSDEVLQLHDREMLEDLIRSAVNQAMNKAREAIAAETAKMTETLGLPPGLKLPGVG
ncbi:MAG: YbaB/EbfC family nucleoid-associated protein [Gemmataceae bacterium]